MATRKKSAGCTKIEQPKVKSSNVKTQLYPLKKAIKIGDELRPIGYKIPLTKDGYRFFKQQNIV